MGYTRIWLVWTIILVRWTGTQEQQSSSLVLYLHLLHDRIGAKNIVFLVWVVTDLFVHPCCLPWTRQPNHHDNLQQVNKIAGWVITEWETAKPFYNSMCLNVQNLSSYLCSPSIHMWPFKWNYLAVLSCGAVCYAVQGGSYFWFCG